MTGKVLFSVLAAGLCLGCVDQYGRVRPPDPIGQAIFNALDPGIPVYQPQEYAVETDIPALRNERRPVAPIAYSDPVWIDGYWAWGGSDWVWVPGRWVQRPRSNVVWSNGRYYTIEGRRYWRSGYWQRL